MATGPRILKLDILPENWEAAKQASSGGCLVADAIKKQYPRLSAISVDMATIRATDKRSGERIMWLTPESAQTILLSFDQGWEQPLDRVQTGRAVHIIPVAAKSVTKLTQDKARLAELDTKVEAKEKLSDEEKKERRRLKVNASRAPRRGKVTVKNGQVHGGRPAKQGEAHPNLLRGRNRLFGAKTSKPAEVFLKAVEARAAELVAATDTK